MVFLKDTQRFVNVLTVIQMVGGVTHKEAVFQLHQTGLYLSQK